MEGDETLSATEEGRAKTASPGRPVDEEAPLPTVLVDRYRLERRLGAGGMGVVFAARDNHLGRAVAVKFVGPRIDPGSGQGHLVREAQAMAKLRHPNIATVHDIGVSGRRLFVVMELVDGGSVADWLKAAPRSWREIVAVYLQAARGLAAAHAAGFVHRDFKSENVLIGQDGVARVCDFGVAHILGDAERAIPVPGVATREDVTMTDGVVGTAGYIAPEILRHERVDERADQFSFCVAVYAALHGARPFKPIEGPGRIAETLGKLTVPRAGKKPRWLERIIMRGLAAEPRDRWPTIAALAAAVERRLARRRRARVLTAVGVATVAAAASWMVTRPVPVPDWSPVLYERESQESPYSMAVSPDGSTVLRYSDSEAWVTPRIGGEARRRVARPVPGTLWWCTLSRTGDQVFCSIGVAPGTIEIWEVDVVTGRAERRFPKIAAPPLAPRGDFDVAPDGSILFAVFDGSAVWRVDRSGAVQKILAARPGEWFDGSVWSPDGDRIAVPIQSREGARIAIMNADTRSMTVVSRRSCQIIAWLTASSLVCAPGSFRNTVLVELLLPSGGGAATERVRYRGPEYQEEGGLSASSAGILLATNPAEMHLALLALDAPGTLSRIASGGVSDLPAAGWTSSGSLIFGSSVQGQLRIMRMLPSGVVETVRTGSASEVPLVVLGETIVFGRFPGGESTVPFTEPPIGRRYPDDGELFRRTPDGALEFLDKTHGFMDLLCAGGRATPCLLQERSGDDVIAIDWDSATGARGRERARWSMAEYSGRSTLSADGRTLAQLHKWRETGDISLLDLQSGDRRTIAVPGTFFENTEWQPDNTLFALKYADGERGIARVRDGVTIEMVAVVPPRDEPLSVAHGFRSAPDGKTIAILIRDARKTYWWIPRPHD